MEIGSGVETENFMEMELSGENMPLILVESQGFEGVRRIAARVAEDVEKVTGSMPKVVTEKGLPAGERSKVILCATLGRSPALEELARKGLVDLSGLMAESRSMGRARFAGEKTSMAEPGITEEEHSIGEERFMDDKQSAEEGRSAGEERFMGEKHSAGEGRHGKWEVYQIKMIDMSGKAFHREEWEAEGVQNVQEAHDVCEESGFPWEGIDRMLLICGSDKRGTIYGMFALSEYIGVSPFSFWGDAEPARLERVILHQDIETVSKEPSVKYRGFFINDEWPCFGNWVTEHFGGFNSKAYELVFEFLLRLKGNYLWPAMWSASFPLDGPGSANEELADLYGVVIGYSHHEPCLRASEEWGKVRGEGSRYGNQWNFRTNEEGLLRYWEDGLKRSGKYEHIITVGMRGERDTSVLGADSLEENIALLKNIITKQRKLIERYAKPEYYGNPEHQGESCGNLEYDGERSRNLEYDGEMCRNPGHDGEDCGNLKHDVENCGNSEHDVERCGNSERDEESRRSSEHNGGSCNYSEHNVEQEDVTIPQLLALYKEVEPYFYGDAHIPGLKDWEGLDGVNCMFCEDNYGYMRTLPEADIRGRKGGFGMYYHLDYHGGPVSYEWVDSTPLSQVWEQMSEAYEYGVREAWMVNVGDLKFHEVPLSYFMALAYDYDRWGYGNRKSCEEYTELWARQCFPEEERELQRKAGRVLTAYIRLNSLRRPEALHAGIYHPCHYGETERMLKMALETEKLSCQVMEEMKDNRPYYSMVHYPAMASMNLLKMHLYAGKNHHYAVQGRKAANLYGELVQECIRLDRKYQEEWALFREGKWNGMQMAPHIGFTKWNEDDCRYPLMMKVEPVGHPVMSVSRRDREETATKKYGEPMVIAVPDFMDAGCEKVTLEIGNGGYGSFRYCITVNGVEGSAETADGGGESAHQLPGWLEVFPMEGTVESLQEVSLICRRERLPREKQTVSLSVKDEAAEVIVEVSGQAVKGCDKILAVRDRMGMPVIKCSEVTDDGEELPPMTFFPRKGVVSIGAEHYCRKKDREKGSFQIIEDYGKYNCGVKVFPSTAAFGEKDEKPELVYRFLAEETGEYRVELYTAPANPLVYGESVNLVVSSGEKSVKAQLIPADFRSGDSGDDRWAKPALDKVRKTIVKLPFRKDVQELAIGAMEAGTILERILIYQAEKAVEEAYLGSEESSHT